MAELCLLNKYCVFVNYLQRETDQMVFVFCLLVCSVVLKPDMGFGVWCIHSTLQYDRGVITFASVQNEANLK